jgi:unsaturated chondroitin disaccharide hydrolase
MPHTDSTAVRKEPLAGRFTANGVAALDRSLIERSIATVLGRIERNLDAFGERFPAPSSVGGVYASIDNVEWTNGFWTGMLWLAYELTGAQKFRSAAERQVESFAHRLRDRINVDHHDLGFLYTLSCVAAHRLTGSDPAKRTALEAARLLLSRFNPQAGIIQAWGDPGDPEQAGRMIIDCNLNLPLLYWAGEMTGEVGFAAAANSHVAQAARHIVRDDASTFHTYYLDPVSGKPLRGSTHQGFADDSCWARGQAWGIYGFPLAYRHNNDAGLIELAKKLANYFLNRLPEDAICCWDLCFTSGYYERDSSAAAIAACGLLEIAQVLPLADAERSAYERAAWTIVSELSRHYLPEVGDLGNGVLRHAVYHMPKRIGVDESCIWGDYFFLEALVRLQRPWVPYW